jgi:hypothetical protein
MAIRVVACSILHEISTPIGFTVFVLVEMWGLFHLTYDIVAPLVFGR